MKKQLITLGLILSIGTLAIAGPGHKNHKNNQHNRFVEELNLTDEQRVQFDAIMKSKKEGIQAAMQVIHEETQAQLATVLSAEQMQAVESNKMRGKKRMQRHRFHNSDEE